VGDVIPLHMGALHPFEQALTLVLAFGPFVVLGLVIAHRRRAESREAQPEGHPEGQGEGQRER
jgi:hypothetical protein